MSNFLIIDSNKRFAEKLKQELSKNGQTADLYDIPPSDNLRTSYLFNISQQLKNKEERIVLINIESKVGTGKFQNQKLVELLFWLRCKYRLKNPIVTYSCQSINQILKRLPKNYIILSPGCHHLQLPINEQQIKKIAGFKPLEGNEFNEIKQFLKPRVDLKQTRHSYANYAGMNLMLNIAKQVYGVDENQILDNASGKFTDFYNFRDSLDYHILSMYFDLEKTTIANEEEKEQLKIGGALLSKKILLVDDLADKGWENILRQIIYGDILNENLISLTIGDNLITEIESVIDSHKPHLILLDLRLKDEENEKKISELDGFKLLEHIKSHKKFKGLPVVMFTSSSNAETIKELLNAGAEAVWTKPGIDEALGADDIKERYKKLVDLVSSVFEPDYSLLNQLDDNPDEFFDVSTINFESIRSLLFRKLDFVRYRLQLYKDDMVNLLPEPYKSVDAIYIDSNSLFSGNTGHNFSDLITSVLILSILSSESGCSFVLGGQNSSLTLPKVVVMNSVYDEVIKLAKIGELRWNAGYSIWSLTYKRAAISQLIIKELFDNNNIRTELHCDENKKVESRLEIPKENPYADGYILDEIASLVVTRKSKEANYGASTKVIFVSGDKGLSNKIIRFNDPKKNNLILKTREEFIEDISRIEF